MFSLCCSKANASGETGIMRQTIRKIWNIIGTILIVMVVVLAVLLAGVRIFGLQVFTVLSGSMEPTYHVGSLIYVRQIDPYEIQVGQAITFMLDENTVATHRVVEIVPDEEDSTVIRFRTKGDANDVVDGSLVHYKNVLGVPVFTIPYLGYVANYVQKPPGLYVAISGCAMLLLFAILPDLLADSEKEAADRSGKRIGTKKDAERKGKPSKSRKSRKNRPGNKSRNRDDYESFGSDEFGSDEFGELDELAVFDEFGESDVFTGDDGSDEFWESDPGEFHQDAIDANEFHPDESDPDEFEQDESDSDEFCDDDELDDLEYVSEDDFYD
jgi:signal peptidase I